jgi:hypothetical protein
MVETQDAQQQGQPEGARGHAVEEARTARVVRMRQVTQEAGQRVVQEEVPQPHQGYRY